MLYNFFKLKARIFEKFGSQAAFAEALGTSEVLLSRKLVGKTAFTCKDIEKWIKLLDIAREEIGAYFFTLKV